MLEILGFSNIDIELLHCSGCFMTSGILEFKLSGVYSETLVKSFTFSVLLCAGN